METKKRTRWTDEMLIADALKYKTRCEWKRGSSSAYQVARKRNLLEVCCAGMRQLRTDWTTEMLIADASRFKTRAEWKRESVTTYSAAQKRNLLDVCCAHMRQALTSWTNEMLIADAKRFETRGAWARESSAAYDAARKRNLLEVCCGHMTAVLTYWSTDMLKADALKYKTRGEWLRNSANAYNAAHKRGLLDACCAHMERAGGTDNDAVYIWKAIGQFYNGNQVYKIGVTSARLGEIRVLQCANQADFDAEIVILANVDGKATEVEKYLLAIGADPKYVGFNGASEFRAMTDEQLAQAVRLVSEATQETLKEAA